MRDLWENYVDNRRYYLMLPLKIYRTNYFNQWLMNLRDSQIKHRIEAQIERMIDGNFGTVRFVGEGVYEKKLDFGPGYRLYYTKVAAAVILLLFGGDKSRQTIDIGKAILIRKELLK